MKARMFLLVLALCLLPCTAGAAARVQKVEFEAGGKVEVDFKGQVQYQSVKALVTDEKGKEYAARIVDKDKDDMELRVSGLQEGVQYTVTIEGIRAKGEKTYGSVSAALYVPKCEGPVPLKKIEVGKSLVTFDFLKAAQYKSLKVTITRNGKNYVKSIKDKEKKEIEVRVKKLTSGKLYEFTITGIRRKGTKKYGTLKGNFVA